MIVLSAAVGPASVLSTIRGRGRQILAARAARELPHEDVDLAMRAEVGVNTPRFIDPETRADALRVHRLAHGGKARDLALVADAAEAERFGGGAISLAEAVLDRRRQDHVLSAVDGRELSVGEMAMAVVHGIAAAVGGDQQRLIPRTVEQRRQRVRFVVIIEVCHRIVAEAAVTVECGDVEERGNVAGVMMEDIRQHRPPRLALDVSVDRRA
jgi:hypothetical protein